MTHRRTVCAGAATAAAVIAVLSAAVPAPSAAQDSVRVDTAPAVQRPDTAPPRALPVNGLLLSPQHLSYRMIVQFPDSEHVIGTREVDLQRSTYSGFPAWLAVETRWGSVVTVDSLYMAYVNLRPLHWGSTIGSARMALEFTPDSIYGATSGPTGSQNIVLGHGFDLLAGSAMSEIVLQLVPHTVGRTDSVSVLEVDLGSARVLPGALSVVGEQDIDTADGLVHCWVVSLSVGDSAVRYWVSESDPVVVRTRQDLPGQPGVAFEQRLISR